MEVDKLADMLADMVADVEVNMVATITKEVATTTNEVTTITKLFGAKVFSSRSFCDP